MPPVLADPVGHVPERTCPQPTRTPLGLTSLLDEPGSLQHPQVLRDRGLAHVERFGEILDRGLASGEASQDRPPGRVGQGGECRAERVRLRHVHHY